LSRESLRIRSKDAYKIALKQVRFNSVTGQAVNDHLLSGWWYGKNFYNSGTLIGANDELQLSGKRKLTRRCPRETSNHSTARTFVWAGTWSFVMPSLLSELPLIILLFVIVAAYLRAAVRAPPRGSEWIYPLTLVLFLTGLFHQALVYLALYATISVGAYYLHSLAPVLAPMLGRGLAEVQRWRAAKPFVGAVLLYPILFLPFGTGILALYYAGCGDKYPDHPFYDFSSAKSCVSNLTGIIHNLSVLSAPWLSIMLFIVGWALMLIGMILNRVLLVGRATSWTEQLTTAPRSS
jgi:hypothetical protein